MPCSYTLCGSETDFGAFNCSESYSLTFRKWQIMVVKKISGIFSYQRVKWETAKANFNYVCPWLVWDKIFDYFSIRSKLMESFSTTAHTSVLTHFTAVGIYSLAFPKWQTMVWRSRKATRDASPRINMPKRKTPRGGFFSMSQTRSKLIITSIQEKKFQLYHEKLLETKTPILCPAFSAKLHWDTAVRKKVTWSRWASSSTCSINVRRNLDFPLIFPTIGT